MPDDLRHENISNDLQTTCHTLEIQLKELRAENDAKDNQIANLNAMISMKGESLLEAAEAEGKKLRAQVSILSEELKTRSLQQQESFTRLLDEVKTKNVDQDGEIDVPSDRGDSDKIDSRLLKKSVS